MINVKEKIMLERILKMENNTVRDINGIDYHELEIRTCKSCGGMYLTKIGEQDQGVCKECFGKMLNTYKYGTPYRNKREPADRTRTNYYNRNNYKQGYSRRNGGYNNRNRDRFEPLLDENGDRVYKAFHMMLDKEEREFLEALSKNLHETKKKIIFDALKLYSESDEIKEKLGVKEDL